MLHAWPRIFKADQDDDEEPQQMVTRVPQDTCSDDTSPDTQSSTYGPDSVASRNFVAEQWLQLTNLFTNLFLTWYAVCS